MIEINVKISIPDEEMLNTLNQVVALLKANGQNRTLTAPEFQLVSQNPSEVVISVTRTDSNGETMRWEIGKNIDLSGDVIGISQRTGVLSGSGNITIQTNGFPIEDFYFSVRDRAVGYQDGVATARFIDVDDPVFLVDPAPVAQPSSNSATVTFVEDPNAALFLLEVFKGDVRVSQIANASSPQIVNLDPNTTYRISVTAISDSVLYKSISSNTTIKTQPIPLLNPPTDLTFVDNGGGSVTVTVVYSGSPDTYVIERDGIQVYSGASNQATITGHVANQNYTYRAKVKKSGFNDSAYYQEVYSYPTVADVDTIEDYGGQQFYESFFGSLTYTPLNNGTTQVTFQGSEKPFNASYVGKWLEPSRIHHNPIAYPSSGRNYFPNIVGVVYSKVVSVIDGKNLIVDFQYNGRNRANPSVITNQDGTFFFDNKSAIELWGNNVNRRPLSGTAGAIYAVLGCPRINCVAGNDYDFVTDSNNPAVLHFMASDAFTIDETAEAISLCPSYVSQYGSNTTFFNLPGSGEVNIDFQWQPVGPTYTPAVVQYGSVGYAFFVDKNGTSTNFGLKRAVSKNPYVIRDLMQSELGSVRTGANYVMPSQGGCNSGGANDGIEITNFNTYRFEGSWITKNTCDFKGRNSGGVLLEWIGEVGNEGQFIDMDELSATQFDISVRWNNNRQIRTSSDSFTWYQATGQYWTGGLNTVKLPNDKVRIGNFDVWLGNNGDWGVIGQKVQISSDTVSSFNRIPAVGNVIRNSATDSENSLIRKISNTEWVIWGYAIQVGDVLTFGTEDYTIAQLERVSYTWTEYKASLNRSDRFITAFKVVLNKPITRGLQEVSFTVKTSQLAYLLNGAYVQAKYIYDNIPFTNLWYGDSNVNVRFENVKIHGNIRCTSPDIPANSPLWQYSSIAEYTNVFLINRDGSDSFSNRNEYQPFYLRRRQLETSDNSYRFKVSGGRVGIIRDTLFAPEYEFSNRPHLVRNAVQGERVIIYNPIVSDGLGLVMGVETPVFSRVQLGMTDGMTIDISNSELKNNLEVFGNGTLIVDGMQTNLRAGSNTLYYAIEIWDNFSSPRNINIEGDNGDVGIAILRNITIGEFSLNLTNWNLLPGFNNGTGFTTFQNTSDPNYCSYISVNGNCLP